MLKYINRYKCLKTTFEIASPIASDAVAAGDGALQTFITPGFSKIKKSSTSEPACVHA